jgi:hypothetical protein
MTKSINQLLREALEERATASTALTRCLDAETAAALADDMLSAGDRSGAEAHVAQCPRCQAVLAALVRTTPAASAPAWWRRPVMAWLAPLAVAAATVAVWVSVPRHTTVAPPAQSARAEPSSVEADSSRPSPPVVATEMGSLSARKSAAAPVAASGAVDTRNRDRRAPAESVPETMRQNAPTDNRNLAPSAAQGGSSAASARAADAQSPASLPAAPPPAAADSGGAARAEPPRSLAERTTVTSLAGRALLRRFDVPLETVVVSSNPLNRWRIGTDGVVQHSSDGGSTWQTQSTGVSVTLTAGSSPSPSVCWLVGPAGLVLNSTDEGRSWQRLVFPVAIDLISVRASDDKTAEVMTTDRRTFSTSDGGRNWRRSSQ